MNHFLKKGTDLYETLTLVLFIYLFIYFSHQACGIPALIGGWTHTPAWGEILTTGPPVKSLFSVSFHENYHHHAHVQGYKAS